MGRTVLVVLGLLVAVAVLVFVGWVQAPPLSNGPPSGVVTTTAPHPDCQHG